MFLAAFFGFLVLVVAILIIGFGINALLSDEGLIFFLGIIFVLAGCAVGAGSFMLFVHAAQLA